MIFVVVVVTSEKGSPVKSWETSLCKFANRALAGPLYGKNTFLCFTYRTGKVEIDLRHKTEVCVKDVYTTAQADAYLCVMMNEI